MSEPARDANQVQYVRAPLGVVRVEGEDAAAFLHAQLASDVAALGDGTWHWSAYLDPQGRVVALLMLVRHAAARFDLLLPGTGVAPFHELLRRYVLRSKVRIDAGPELGVEAVAMPGRDAVAAPALGGAVHGGGGRSALTLDGSAARVLRIAPSDVLAATPAGSDWTLADVADAIPWIAPPQVGEFTAHALGLARLGAFSLSKGCYPGQEIVARMHYLGRARRGLVRFAGAGPLPSAGDRLHGATAAAPVGQVLFAARDADGRVRGLAVVGEAPAQARIELSGAVLTVDLEPIAGG